MGTLEFTDGAPHRDTVEKVYDHGDGNWIQTVPGKGYFVILRCYSPLTSFFDKTWQAGEIERVQ